MVSCDSQEAKTRLSKHGCCSHNDVWRALASLVTEGLQLQASDIITGSLRAVDFASLVLMACIMCELYMLFG